MLAKKYCIGLLAVLVLCGLTLPGLFSSGPGKTRTLANEGWIEGQVTNGTDPLQNAFVLYVMNTGGGPMGATTTDATGHYNFTVIGGITYTVIAFHGDYYSANGVASPDPGETVTLDLVEISISPLVANVVIKGFVLDTGGNPVLGGDVLGFVNDPLNMGEGAPVYADVTTADPGTGAFTVYVIPGTAGGGAGAMNFAGYPFTENSTKDAFMPLETYWFNITLATPVSTDDARLKGFVTDYYTSAPLSGVIVTVQTKNQWNQGGGKGGYSNFSMTNESGYYQMNVTNGTGMIFFQASGYSMFFVDGVTFAPGSKLKVNATLVPTNALVRGNVTDLKTKSPLANVRVFFGDSHGHLVMATTNASGGYEMDAFNGTDLRMNAEREGYTRNETTVSIMPGDELWVDFGLWPVDSWITGRVTDRFSGTPLGGVGVWLQSPGFNTSSGTNSSGVYNMSLFSGNYTIQVNGQDYMTYSAEVHVTPGGNVLNITLMPMRPPHTVKMFGWVNDTVSGGLKQAQMNVGLAPPFNDDSNFTQTNNSGYYEMWIPPIAVQYVAKATNHTHAEGIINASGLTEIRLDMTLNSDPWGPNITYQQSPTTNVSWTNACWFNMTIVEKDPEQFALMQFMFMNASGGFSDYVLIQMLNDNFDPLGNGPDVLPFTRSGDRYDISYSWQAMVNAGWLRNSTDAKYLGAMEIPVGPTTYEGMRAQYTNSTLGSWYQGTVWFDKDSGDFVFFSFDNRSMQMAYPTDPTGVIVPLVSALRVNNTNNNTGWINDVPEGSWSIVGLHFQINTTVPSGNYIAQFMAGDFGNKWNGNISFYSVDNTPPTSNAGSDQLAAAGETVFFDGTESADNVGVANFTWTFDYDGSPITLYGPTPSFVFLTEGVYDVTLTVRDGAGHVNQSMMKVTIGAAIPEFPTIIIPILGLMVLLPIVRMRRRNSLE